MDRSILLPVLVLIPLFSGFAVALLPRGRDGIVRTWALSTSLFVFLLSLLACWQFDFGRGATTQLQFAAPWIEPLGVAFRFGADSISLSLVLLTTFLMPITILGSYSAITQRVREFYCWLLVLQAAMIGVFVAQDLILFYTFFELTLVPMYFLIGIYGSTQRRRAAARFFIFTLAGSVFTLGGVLYVAWFNATVSGQWTFEIAELYHAALLMSPTQQGWVLAALLAGFAVKVPLFPVHTWLPLAHTEAPTAGSVILAGVLLKLGTYGLLRFALPLAPVAVVSYAPLIAVISIIGILYAALICWVQQDVKKLVAYSSVSHLGFCVLGMFALNTIGVTGSVMYMINHGLSTGALFLCVGMIYERYHTRDMDQMSGLGKRLPVWATFMVFFCLASVGLPGLNGFVGEFLTLLGTYQATGLLGIGYAAVAAVGLILGAIYILYMVGRVVLGPVKEPATHGHGVKDLGAREIAVLTPLAIGCFVLGIYPTPLLKALEPAVDAVIAAPRQVVAHGTERLQSPPLSTDPNKADPTDWKLIDHSATDAVVTTSIDRRPAVPLHGLGPEAEGGVR